MAEQHPQETIHVPLATLTPLTILNEFRARHGLPPSRNLISSGSATTNTKPPGDSSAQQPPRDANHASTRDRENCRLWITGLPATCTVHQLLRGIRGAGPILACDILAPDPTRGASGTGTGTGTGCASAALTFFTPDGANRLLAQTASAPLAVGDRVATVERHSVHARATGANGRSRVVRILGDPAIVQPRYLARVFAECWLVRFDTDFVAFRAGAGCDDDVEGGAPNDIIWAFGSYRGQAQVICAKINRFFSGRVWATYLVDPCAF